MAMPVKAPPPPPPPPSWWSGFVELDGESFLINPQGQALIKTGTATLVAGVNLTLYKDKTGFINNVTVGGLVASDWSGAGFVAGSYWNNGGANSTNGALFDVVFAVSQSVTFAQYWTLSNEFLNVYSLDVQDTKAVACGLTTCSGFPALIWDQVKLSLNDSFTGWPITFNPYVLLWYELNSAGSAASGLNMSSAACFPCAVNNYDFMIGMTPTIDLQKQAGIPVTLKFPTYVTVGPTSFWNAAPGVFGASSGSVGLFTTGMTAVMPLSWIPGQYGHWYAKAGFQWYDVINTALQNGNAFSVDGNLSCAKVSSGDCSSIFVGFGGVGVAF
ncbi:MAG TPA: hypothetical protein VK442_07225 [Xanthobacteraceae bacterium]|nr:hypothetical protein [Xanthobacteraceae bacterium]